ncbi:MAG TPA: glycine cleavage system protein GcvH [Planctomycetota bacterium]|nr:glycine cleavage system protein GcvH [Planctomycetota bacterium]
MGSADIVPADLRYTKEHEWVRIEGDEAVVGITHHAQEALGEVTYVELPATGKRVEQFGELAVIESAKAASDVYSPIGGVVIRVNESLRDAPEKVNAGPYGEGWICRLSNVDPAQTDKLLSPEEYAALLESKAS